MYQGWMHFDSGWNFGSLPVVLFPSFLSPLSLVPNIGRKLQRKTGWKERCEPTYFAKSKHFLEPLIKEFELVLNSPPHFRTALPSKKRKKNAISKHLQPLYVYCLSPLICFHTVLRYWQLLFKSKGKKKNNLHHPSLFPCMNKLQDTAANQLWGKKQPMPNTVLMCIISLMFSILIYQKYRMNLANLMQEKAHYAKVLQPDHIIRGKKKGNI